MERIFLAIIGVLYIVLALWCAVAPDKTSQAVGFTLTPGKGQSEFLAVYGGLELALGLFFLWPLWRPEQVAMPLLFCVILHACLVVFRTAGFFLFTGIATVTYYLAALEWLIFLTAASLLWRRG